MARGFRGLLIASAAVATMATLGATLGATPGLSAEPCIEVPAIAFLGSEGGRLTVRLNEASVAIDHRGSVTGHVLEPLLLMEDENTISVTLTAVDETARPSARVELLWLCRGHPPKPPGENHKGLAVVALDAPGHARTTVTREVAPFELPDYSYTWAPATDSSGLLEAIEAMRAAARTEDLDRYLAFYRLMFDDFELIGDAGLARIDATRRRAAELLGGHFDVVDSGPLTLSPVLGGRAYEVRDEKGLAPLQFKGRKAADGLAEEVAQAAFWIKLSQHDGQWYVLRQ